MNQMMRTASTAVALAAAVTGLSACSGSSKASTETTTGTSSKSGAADSASASGRAAGRNSFYASPQVQACLKAAGIAVPTARARPSGTFTGTFPSGGFTGARPSGTFTGARPSGGFANSPEQQKIDTALKACGLTLPTFGPRLSGSGAVPPASPSS